MKTKGIRILDDENNVVSVRLEDILKEIPNGNEFFWSILYLEGIYHARQAVLIPVAELEKQINGSERGMFITWDDLQDFARRFFQIKDVILLGSKDETVLRRYDTDQEMYEACDIFINMFDCCFWEVFSKDEQWINQLAKKFKEVKFLESDFQKAYT